MGGFERWGCFEIGPATVKGVVVYGSNAVAQATISRRHMYARACLQADHKQIGVRECIGGIGTHDPFARKTPVFAHPRPVYCTGGALPDHFFFSAQIYEGGKMERHRGCESLVRFRWAKGLRHKRGLAAR